MDTLLANGANATLTRAATHPLRPEDLPSFSASCQVRAHSGTDKRSAGRRTLSACTMATTAASPVPVRRRRADAARVPSFPRRLSCSPPEPRPISGSASASALALSGLDAGEGPSAFLATVVYVLAAYAAPAVASVRLSQTRGWSLLKALRFTAAEPLSVNVALSPFGLAVLSM